MKQPVYTLYSLVCPQEKCVRYIGVTCQPIEKRLKNGHLYRPKEENPHKYNWIQKKLTNVHEGGNLPPNALGKKRSKETKRKMSEAAKIHRRKSVLQFSKDGIYLREWSSIKLAQEKFKITHISECCTGKQKTSGGFIWKHKSSKEA